MTDHTKHDQEVQRNRQLWAEKPLARLVYAHIQSLVAQHCCDLDKPTVEIGSGIGHIKNIIPDCVTTDIAPREGIDQVENIYHLSFADASVANFLLIHVFHHLRHPGRALAELHRCLAPGGRIIIFEPFISLLGRLAYGPCHPEPIAMHAPVDWDGPTDFDPARDPYYAAQGNATRIFVRGEHADRLAGWQVLEKRVLSMFSYVLSGGYSGPQLYPMCLLGLVRAFEKIGDRFPSLFGTCLLVVLEKSGH
jgi:SAM-dependent methyltransferase